MLTRFPRFSDLLFVEREEIEAFTACLPCYSDFNFTSLWCWNIREKVQVSELNGNLVVRFTDYLTDEPFFSFCGAYEPAETAATLIEHARSEGISPILKLVPSETASVLPAKFRVSEDPDNFDYILAVPDMVSFSGNRLHGKRTQLCQFRRYHPAASMRELDFADADDRANVRLLLERWAKNKSLAATTLTNEAAALRRFMSFDVCRGQSQFLTLGVFESKILIGFSMAEVLSDRYAMFHFEKADIRRAGIYAYLMHETARRLSERGCHYINYQQDLGMLKLRRAKRQYNPAIMLKKFRVSA